MLKLEKTSHSSFPTLRMRERERFFEPRLLKALLIALFLHVSALVLFHVTPFHFSSTFIFPPIRVQTDWPPHSVSVLTTPRQEEEVLFPPSVALIPALDWISSSQESTLMPSLNLDPYAFQDIEKQVWPQWQEPLSLQLEEPRIQLTISGDLAQHSLVATDSLLQQMQPLSWNEPHTYVTYQVLLDNTTGELFWYERIDSHAETVIYQLTEKILLNLRFSFSETQPIVKGTLRFVIPNEVEEF